VIAAAHFNRLARERGLPFRAVPRGTEPDDVVAAGVRKGLASNGIDVSTWRPTSVSDQDLRQAAQVISLATDLPKTKPDFKSGLLEWNDIPPVSDDYNLARSAIVERVRKLLDALSPPKRLKASVEAPERSLDEFVGNLSIAWKTVVRCAQLTRCQVPAHARGARGSTRSRSVTRRPSFLPIRAGN